MFYLDYPVPNEIIDDVLNSLSQTKHNKGVPLVKEDIKNAYQAGRFARRQDNPSINVVTDKLKRSAHFNH